MKDAHLILKKPLITEKCNLMKDECNQITFEVNRKANKIEIKEAVEKFFKVHVVKVRTMTMQGKKKRMGRSQGMKSDWKKAIVTLKQGDTIDLFGGV